MTAYPALEGWNRSLENNDGSVAKARDARWSGSAMRPPSATTIDI